MIYLQFLRNKLEILFNVIHATKHLVDEKYFKYKRMRSKVKSFVTNVISKLSSATIGPHFCLFCEANPFNNREAKVMVSEYRLTR